jgi:predicted GNAT family acetyltransferase
MIVEDGPDDAEQIAIAYNGSKPVAIAYKHTHVPFWMSGHGFGVAVYVDKSCRRRGIGTKLVAKLTQGKSFAWGEGVEGSVQFFEKILKTG